MIRNNLKVKVVYKKGGGGDIIGDIFINLFHVSDHSELSGVVLFFCLNNYFDGWRVPTPSVDNFMKSFLFFKSRP